MKQALIAFGLFLMLWCAVAYVPQSYISDETRGNAFFALCLVFGTAVNFLIQRWLRVRKEESEVRIAQRAKEEEEQKKKQKEEAKKAKEVRLLAKAKKREEEEKAKNKSTVVIEEITDGTAVSDDAYRPKKKAVTKAKSCDAWDRVDYEAELIKVNGDPRATGELDKKEAAQLEMMKMYYQDPVGTEKALKQANQMKALQKVSRMQKAKAEPQETAQEAEVRRRAEAKANLQKVLEKSGASGAVFSADDLETSEGMAKFSHAMAHKAA